MPDHPVMVCAGLGSLIRHVVVQGLRVWQYDPCAGLSLNSAVFLSLNSFLRTAVLCMWTNLVAVFAS